MHRLMTGLSAAAMLGLLNSGSEIRAMTDEENAEWEVRQIERKRNEEKEKLDRDFVRKYGCTENRMPHQGAKEKARRAKRLAKSIG